MKEFYSRDASNELILGPQGFNLPEKSVKLAAHNQKPFNSKVLGDSLHLQQVQTKPAAFQPLLKVKTINERTVKTQIP